jgi:hypothetical protein
MHKYHYTMFLFGVIFQNIFFTPFGGTWSDLKQRDCLLQKNLNVDWLAVFSSFLVAFQLTYPLPFLEAESPISMFTAAYHWKSLSLCANRCICRHQVNCRAHMVKILITQINKCRECGFLMYLSIWILLFSHLGSYVPLSVSLFTNN